MQSIPGVGIISAMALLLALQDMSRCRRGDQNLTTPRPSLEEAVRGLGQLAESEAV